MPKAWWLLYDFGKKYVLWYKSFFCKMSILSLIQNEPWVLEVYQMHWFSDLDIRHVYENFLESS